MTVAAKRMIRAHCADACVRERMLDFAGGSPPSAVYGSDFDQSREFCLKAWPPKSVAGLDVEYVIFDFTGECQLDPHRAFEVQEPVETAAQEALLLWGIGPLHVMSRRGSHFVWQARRGSPAFRRLAAVAPEPDCARGPYEMPCGSWGRPLAGQPDKPMPGWRWSWNVLPTQCATEPFRSAPPPSSSPRSDTHPARGPAILSRWTFPSSATRSTRLGAHTLQRVSEAEPRAGEHFGAAAHYMVV